MGFSPSHFYGRGVVSDVQAVRAFWAVKRRSKKAVLINTTALSGQQDELSANSFNKSAIPERFLEMSF